MHSNNKLHKCLAVIFVLLHIIYVLQPQEVFAASRSINYKLNPVVVATGGGKASAGSANPSMAQAVMGQVTAGKTANYAAKVDAGYIPPAEVNPPAIINDFPLYADIAVTPSLDLSQYFAGAGGKALTYSVTGNDEIDVTITGPVAAFSNGSGFAGVEKIRFTAEDTDHYTTVSPEIALLARAVSGNNPPILFPVQHISVNGGAPQATPPDQITIQEGHAVRLLPEAYDPDGDTLTFDYSAPLDSNGEWTAGFTDSGIYESTVTVEDPSGASDSREVTINVQNINRAPVFKKINGVPLPEGAVLNYNEGDFIKIEPEIYDPDGDYITVNFSSPLDSDGEWQTTYTDGGAEPSKIFSFDITASDETVVTVQSLALSLTNMNALPATEVKLDSYNIAINGDFIIYVVADDADGDALTVTAAIKDSSGVIVQTITDFAQYYPGRHKASTSIATAGFYTIEANVSDAAGSVSDSCNIDIIDPAASTDGEKPISGDFNSDGVTDIGIFDSYDGIWKIALSQNGVFTCLEEWPVGAGAFGDETYWVPLIGDYNSDGLTDIGIRRDYADSDSEGRAKIAFNTGTAFTEPVEIFVGVTNFENQWWRHFSGDFNGDGYIDFGKYHWQHTTDNWKIAFSDEGTFTVFQSCGLNFGGDMDTIPIVGDFNGDGLTDVGYFKTGNGDWHIALSKGSTFEIKGAWKTGYGQDKDPLIADFNNDGLTDIGYFDEDSGDWHVAYSNGYDGFGGDTVIISGFGPGGDSIPLTGDYNGDGLLDFAVFDKDGLGTGKWEIRYSTSGVPDLLTKIENGIGGSTEITYRPSTSFDNTGNPGPYTPQAGHIDDGLPDLPFPIQAVKEVVQRDGLGSSYCTKYEYADGYFNTAEREFRGFGCVKVIDAEENISETYFYQDYERKGRPKEERVTDRYGRLYGKTTYQWHYGGTDDAPVYRTAWDGAVPFPALERRVATIYNPSDEDDYKAITAEYDYDEYGNVIKTAEAGFDDVSGDERYTFIEYTCNTAAWILSKPSHTFISTDAAGSGIVSHAWYYYDNNGDWDDPPVEGDLTKEERFLDGGADPATEFTYDDYGNVRTVKDARDSTTTTTYDTASQTFPVRVENALGHSQEFTYDVKTGQILTSKDPNNQITQSIYDGFGRVQKVIGPNDSESSPGIEYFYYLDEQPVRISTVTKLDAGWTSASFAFIDGLGRTIEAKTEAEDDGSGNPRQVISGIVKFDSRGQVKEKYLPYYAPYSDQYAAPTHEQPKIRYEFDAMGRVVRTIRPDGIVSYVNYGITALTTIDENSNRITSEKDAYGRLIEVIEYNGEDEYVTDYEYDILGNLTDTYDSAVPRNHTHITYDSLGRKIAMDDPDMGHWEYGYDVVGNLIWQEDAKHQIMGFKYDTINRLMIKGQVAARGDEPAEGVVYEYDNTAPENPYAKGRLTKVTDLTGTTEFLYDNLGREIRTIKTIPPSLQGPGATEAISCTIERTYDSIDRLKTVTYPDGEIVTYTYNDGGGIETISGLSPQGTVPYVTNIDYNANGQMTKVEYGNGAVANYSYDELTLRLDHLVTQSNTGTIQDLNYRFDNVGNVLSIIDDSGVGTNTQFFEYDDLNRLTKATGDSYRTIHYAYDSIGNMLNKGGLTMQYGEDAGPHAVTSVKDTDAPVQEIDVPPAGYSYKTVKWTQRTDGSMYCNYASYQGQAQYIEYEVDFGDNESAVTSRIEAMNNSGVLPATYTDFQVKIFVDGLSKGIMLIPASMTEYHEGTMGIGDLEGRHTIRLQWLNDYYVEGQYDANIRIGGIRFDVEGYKYIIGYDVNGNMISKEYAEGTNELIYDIENRLVEVRVPTSEYLSGYTIPLNAGWNFISFPVVPAQDINTILANSGIDEAQVSRFNTATQEWEYFGYKRVDGVVQDYSEYCQFTEFEYGRGYEIFVNEEDGAITLSGATPQTGRTLNLQGGWNLVAAPTASAITVEEAFSGLTGYTVYKREGGGYVQLSAADMMEAGKGYFLNVATAQTWHIPREKEITQFVYDGDGGRVTSSLRGGAADEATSGTIYIGSSYELGWSAEETRIRKHIYMGSTKICTVEGTVPEGGLSPETVDYLYYHQDHIGSTNVITNGVGTLSLLYEYAPYGELVKEQAFSSQEPTYEEHGGMVVIEAEHYHNKTVGLNGHEWVENTEHEGYSGTGTMYASPNNGTNQNTGYVEQSPCMDYRVNFAEPGVYTIWVRAWAASGTDDSLHMGLDGEGLETSDRITWWTLNQYRWSKTTMDFLEGTTTPAPATILVTTPGLHTINIWMREDGIYVDKFLLTLDSGYPMPSGTGPAESNLASNEPATAYKFTGKELDESTGLYYYGARYYDPVLCHFITPDTIVPYPDDPQSFNRYSYARNNPIRYIDPTGHSWSSFWKGLFGGAGGWIAGIGGMVLTAVAMIATGGTASAFMPALIGEFMGGIGGVAASAITGGNMSMGFMMGVAAGGVTGGMMGSMGDQAYFLSQKVTEGVINADGVIGQIVSTTEITIRTTATKVAANMAGHSLITSGVGGGAFVLNKVFSTAQGAGSALGASNAPRFYQYMYSSQYRTALNPGEIGIGFKWSGAFYHSGLEAMDASGNSAIIDFNRRPETNIVKTGLGQDVAGRFGTQENYDFYMVVDNNPSKAAEFFSLSKNIDESSYIYNAYGTGNPFNCYEGRDWVLEQLGIPNAFKWPY